MARCGIMIGRVACLLWDTTTGAGAAAVHPNPALSCTEPPTQRPASPPSGFYPKLQKRDPAASASQVSAAAATASLHCEK
jgi:hypothetical protein